MKAPTRLDKQQLETALGKLDGWQCVDDGIEKHLVFTDFSEAFGFMSRVALLCEVQQHHPDWSNTWNKVHIRLTTHESGGITERDTILATSIEQVLQSYS